MPDHIWMDKEVVVNIYNGILLGHKKKHIWVSSSEVDEPRAYYTEWSKSERERQIYQCIYLESKKMVLMILCEGHIQKHTFILMYGKAITIL